MTLAVLFIMLVSVFALPVASAQDDGDTASVAPAELEAASDVQEPPPALEAISDVPEPEPSPTPTLVPPTPEPTPTPTLEPTPTDTPVLTEPTQEPTEPTEPTMLTTGSSDLLESTPAPEPNTIQASEPVATPTTANPPALRSISVQSVIEGNQCALNGTDVVSDTVHGFQGSAKFDCDHVPLGNIGISAPTEGWRYQIWGFPDVPADEWKTEALGPTHYGIEGHYSIFLGPVPGAGTAGCGRVTVSVTVNGTTSSTTLEARTPDVGTGPCPSSDPVQPVTASLIGTLSPLPFSFEPQTGSGLSVQVANPSNTTGWALDISATNLEYSGPANQAALDASNLRVIVSPDVVELSNDVQRIVASGGNETLYEYPVELIIPGETAAGTYTGTVTLDVTAAPGS